MTEDKGKKIQDKPLDERLELYNRAVEMHIEGEVGKHRIARRLGILPTTVGSWINSGQKPGRPSYSNKEKKGYSKFFDWSPNKSKNLSYVLGVLVGDGSVYSSSQRSNYVMKLECKDKEFAMSFKSSLEKIGFNPFLGDYEYWVVKASAKSFVEWYKDLTIKDIEEWIEKNELDFIRGFYDSDGSLRPKHYEIKLTNNDLELLELVQRLLSDIGIKSKIYYADSYRLWFGGKLDVKKFLNLVEPSIPRRKEIEEPSVYVRCKVCNEKFGQITRAHLKKHDMSLSEYKDRFPNAKLKELTDEHKKKIGDANRGNGL